MPVKKNAEVALVAPKKRSLLTTMASQHDLDPNVYLDTIKSTVLKGAANMEQIIAFLMVANKYRLDPVMKQIYAFPSKEGGIVPFMSVDGWIAMAERHPQYDGIEMVWSEKMVVPEGGKACPTWCEAHVYRKDRGHPTVVREYLDECYRKTGPWQSHTKRMLRHKAEIQGFRTAFGYSGIYDEDEAQRITVEGEPLETAATPSSNAARARQALSATPTPDRAPDSVSDEIEASEEPALIIHHDGEDVYVESVEEEEAIDAEVEDVLGPPAPPATRQQLAAITAAKRNNGWEDEDFANLLTVFGVESVDELNREEATDFARALMAGPGEQEEML